MEIETVLRTAKDLKPGEKLTIAGIPMTFEYFSNEHPAFHHFTNGVGIVYINKAFNKETPVSELK